MWLIGRRTKSSTVIRADFYSGTELLAIFTFWKAFRHFHASQEHKQII
jgi:hypothetical protein